MIPTFDEWFEKKYGATFEKMHMAGWMPITTSMKELSRYMREYVSEMAGAKQ
jgi:hypothetical protein